MPRLPEVFITLILSVSSVAKTRFTDGWVMIVAVAFCDMKVNIFPFGAVALKIALWLAC